jgi:alpha-soluble NSF attachment protein
VASKLWGAEEAGKADFDIPSRTERLESLKQEFNKFDEAHTGKIAVSELPDVISFAFNMDTERARKMYLDCIIREAEVDSDGNVNYEKLLEDEKAMFRMFLCADRVVKLERQFEEWDTEDEGTIEASALKNFVCQAFNLVNEDSRESFVNAVLLDCDTSSGLIQEDDLFKSEYFYLMALAEEEEVSARKKPDPGPQKLPLEKPKPIGGGMKSRWEALRGPGLISHVTSGPTLRKGAVQPGVEVPTDAYELYKLAQESIIDDDGTKWWKALDLFRQSAQAYECIKHFGSAADSYVCAADVQGVLGSPVESAETLCKAAEMYTKASLINEAISCLAEAIEVYEDHGRVQMLAILHKQIAELYEQQTKFYNAIQYWEQAAELYCKPTSIVQRFRCNKRAAQLYAMVGTFEEAIVRYEKLADTVIEDNLDGKPSLGRLEVKDLFFISILCQLCTIDCTETGVQRLARWERANSSLQTYEEKDVENIGTDVQWELARELVKAAYQPQLDVMQEAVKKYLFIRTVEPWIADLLDIVQQKAADWQAKVEASSPKCY